MIKTKTLTEIDYKEWPVLTSKSRILTYSDSPNSGGEVYLVNNVYYLSTFSFWWNRCFIITDYKKWLKKKGF